jgi:hypothetical protein
MADYSTTIFVVAHNGGCESYSLPVLAFANKADAIRWCSGQDELFDIAEVPIFPNLPSKPWYKLRPVNG